MHPMRSMIKHEQGKPTKTFESWKIHEQPPNLMEIPIAIIKLLDPDFSVS